MQGLSSSELAVLDLLDSVRHGLNLTSIRKALQHIDPEELKQATYGLWEARRIHRVAVRGESGSLYFVFFTLRVYTIKPLDEPEFTPAMAKRLIKRLEQDLMEQ